jgi:hypothetical protein
MNSSQFILVLIFLSLLVFEVFDFRSNSYSKRNSDTLLSLYSQEEDSTSNIDLYSSPLLVIYGNIENYWGRYAVKHFITTVNALKEKGWNEYIPRSDTPRDTWQEMLVNMHQQFDGRVPDVLLFLQDYDLFHPTKFPFPIEFNKTQKICWFDDTGRNPPQDMGFSLSHASLLLPTYEYLHVRLPSVIDTPRMWMPHSAMSNFELPFNFEPKRIVLLIGMVSGYPVRELIKSKIDNGDKRLIQFNHPGWQPGFSITHIDDFANAIHQHLACIMDASPNNFAIAKIFEVAATGSLLLITDDITDALFALKLIDGVHYISFNRSSLDSTLDYVLDINNSLKIDTIRANGQKLVHNHHMTRHRVDAIHDAGLEAFRVKTLLDKGEQSFIDLLKIQRFPNYKDWAWKDPRNADFYSGKKSYRRLL